MATEMACPFLTEGRHAPVGDLVAERPEFGAVATTRRCWVCGHESTQRWSIQDYREDAACCEELFAMEAAWIGKGRPAMRREIACPYCTRDALHRGAVSVSSLRRHGHAKAPLMRPPSHSHRCQGGCRGRCPCPVRSRDRQQWCAALRDAKALVCLGGRIAGWLAAGVRVAEAASGVRA